MHINIDTRNVSVVTTNVGSIILLGFVAPSPTNIAITVAGII